MAENTSTKIIDIQINTDKALADTAKLSKTVEALTADLKDLKAAEKEGKATREDVLKVDAKLNSAKADLRTQNKLLIASIDSESNSYNQLAAQYAENTRLINAMSESERNSDESAKELISTTEAIRSKMVDMKKATGDNTLNVGNYQESIENATKSMGAFSGGATNIFMNFQDIQGQEGGVKGFFNSLKTGLMSATKAGLQFIATPIGAVIAAVVLGITLITSAIKGNQANADSFGKVWAGISAILDVVQGVLIKLGSALISLFSGDFKGAASAASSAFSNLGESMNKAYKAAVELKTAQIELEKAQARQLTTLAELEVKEKALTLAADDNTKSLKDRAEANKELMVVQQERLKLATDLARRELDIAVKQVNQELLSKGSLMRETAKMYMEKKAAFIKATGEETNVLNENAKKQREIVQDQLMRELDFIIDDYDTKKTIAEKFIQNEKKSDEERKQRMNELKILGEKAFKDEISLIEKSTGKKINAQKLSTAASQEELNNMIKNSGVSDMVAGRLLEIMKERRAKATETAEAETALNESIVNKAIANMDNEIAIYKEKNKTILDGTKALNEEILIEEENRLNESYELDKKSLDAKLKAGQLTQSQYDLAIIQANNAKNEAIKQNNQALYDYENSQKLAQIEADRILNSDNLLYEFEANEAALYEQYLQERGAAVARGEDVTNIDRVYSKQRTEIAKLEADAKMALAEGFAGNLKTIFGEETAIGKAAAIAETTINTYRGATAAYASLAAIPVVGVPLGIAAAGAAIAMGLANVKKIMAVKTPGGGGGGGSMPSGSTSGGGATTLGRGTLTAEVGQGIVSRSVKDSANTSLNVQPVLPVDNVTIAQNKAMQNNKTGTI